MVESGEDEVTRKGDFAMCIPLRGADPYHTTHKLQQ